MSFTLEKTIRLISEKVLRHHISLSKTVDEQDLSIPRAFGTLVSFRIKHDTVYGILTTAHFARGLLMTEMNSINKFLYLSKPLITAKKQELISCVVDYKLVFSTARKGKLSFPSSEIYHPDIAFIAFGISESSFPNLLYESPVLAYSEFYDLDSNRELSHNQTMLYAFFIGSGKNSSDGLLNIAIGGCKKLKCDEELHIQLWEMSDISGQNIIGASGAGFWKFAICEGVLQKSLKGAINTESTQPGCITTVDSSYLNNTFIPQLKEYCKKNLQQNF
jgi:hypothetical protein